MWCPMNRKLHLCDKNQGNTNFWEILLPLFCFPNNKYNLQNGKKVNSNKWYHYNFSKRSLKKLNKRNYNNDWYNNYFRYLLALLFQILLLAVNAKESDNKSIKTEDKMSDGAIVAKGLYEGYMFIYFIYDFPIYLIDTFFLFLTWIKEILNVTNPVLFIVSIMNILNLH